MTYLPGHDGKVTLEKKMISISHQGYKGRNRNYCSHFSVTFDTTGKFKIVFVRLILGKVGLADLPCHNGKLMSGKKLFLFPIKVIRVEIEIIAAIFY